MKPKTGGDFIKYSLRIRFRDFLHDAPGIRKALDDAVRAQTEQERSAQYEVGSIRSLLTPFASVAFV